MGRMLAAFFVLFVLSSYLSGVMAGGDGFAITALSASMNSSDTTVAVTTTAGFKDASTFWMGSEQCSYTGRTATTFTGVTRGYGGTQAATHADDTKVYTEDANSVAFATGFDWAQTVAKAGVLSIIVLPSAIFMTTLPHLGQFNWIFMQGDLWWIGILFYGSFFGMIASIAISMASGAASILKP